jgi:hypothetical protein
MWIGDILSAVKTWVDERRGLEIVVQKIYHRDLTDDDVVITLIPVCFIVEAQITNGHVPRLGVRNVRLTVAGNMYECGLKVDPLQQGDVRDEVLA